MNVLNKQQLLGLSAAVNTMLIGMPEHTDLIAKVAVEAINCIKAEGRDQKQLNKLVGSDEFLALTEGKNLVAVFLDAPVTGVEDLQKLFREGAESNAALLTSDLAPAAPAVSLTEGATAELKTGDGTVATITVSAVALPAPAELPAANEAAVAVDKKDEPVEFGCMIAKIMQDGIARREKEAKAKAAA